MQGIFRKENTDKALKYGIYRHLPTYEKIIRNLVSFSIYKNPEIKVMSDFGVFFYYNNPANITLATVPVNVEINAPDKVHLVFVTFAAIKYTDIV